MVQTRVTAAANLPADGIRLRGSLARQWGIEAGQRVVVRAGGRRAEARVWVGPDLQAAGLVMSPALFGELSFPAGVRLHLRREDGQVFALGPFVGVLALRRREQVVDPFGEHTPFFRHLIRAGVRLAIPTCIFTPGSIDWEEKRIRGYVYRGPYPSGRWEARYFPFPDVVYDRIQTRRGEMQRALQSVKGRIRQTPGVKYFNPGFFSKWHLHSRLASHPDIKRFLPETAPLIRREDLAEFLARYRVVFVKPVAGSLGLGIIKIRRHRGGYALQYRRGGTILRWTPSLARAIRRVQGLAGKRPYIVQQGVRLARVEGRPFDVRLLMQKTGGGVWRSTKVYARIAAPGRFTSNLTLGGEGSSLGPVLRQAFGRRGRRILRRILAAGALLARAIEQQVDGVLGEIGLDIGVDTAGRLWLIEANSKPFLQMTPDAGPRRARLLSAERPLRFSKHLAGFEADRRAEPGSGPPLAQGV